MKMKNRIKRFICLAYVIIYATSYPMQVFAEDAELPKSYNGTNDFKQEDQTPLSEDEFDELLDDTNKEVKGDDAPDLSKTGETNPDNPNPDNPNPDNPNPDNSNQDNTNSDSKDSKN